MAFVLLAALPAASIEGGQSSLAADVFHLERIVDGVLRRAPLEDGNHILGDHRGHVPQALLGLGGAVRGEHHIRPADQRMARRRGLFREDVGGIARDEPGIEPRGTRADPRPGRGWC